jgi:hypothetical protein
MTDKVSDKEYAEQAKAYLQQAFRLSMKIKLEQEKISELRSKINYRSPCFDGNGGGFGGSEDKMAAVVAEIVTYEQEKAGQVLEYFRKYKEIEQTINELEDDAERDILERRYLLNQPWESGYDKNSGKYIVGIADSIGYSIRNAYKKHGSALLKLKIPKN